MSNKLVFANEAREGLRKGAEKVYKAVSSTLGARGRNVVRHNFGKPKITNDGVSVARAIDLEDMHERQGAELLKEAAEKTNSEAGDGTTTATILAYKIFEAGLKLIDEGANPMQLRREIEAEVEKVQAKLKETVVQVTTDEELERVASISIESDEYGKVVADAVKISGKDGIVVVDEGGEKMGVVKEEVNGYRFDRGLENPYLVTNPEKMEANFKADPGTTIPILVADKSWNLVGDLMPLFAEIKKSGQDKLLIIAEEVSGELMQFITQNRLALRFHVVVVKSPYDKEMLEDIAALTGATAVTSAKGIVNVKMSHLGSAKQIIVSRETTTIIDGSGNPDERIAALRGQIESSEDEYHKEKIQARLAKLTGKTVILKVGAATEAEGRYLRDKLDDAVNATKAAVEEGIVPGGGEALARVGSDLYVGSIVNSVQGLMYEVLHAPRKKIIENAGIIHHDIVPELYAPENKKGGFDAKNGVVIPDMMAAGIIDPAKVERVALKHASSLACILLTVDTSIVENPPKDA